MGQVDDAEKTFVVVNSKQFPNQTVESIIYFVVAVETANFEIESNI